MSRFDDKAWWSAHKRGEAAHAPLMTLIKTLRTAQATRYRTMRRLCEIYEYGYKSLGRRAGRDQPLDDERLQFNVAQNGIDTIHTQIITPRVVPMPLTEGGTYTQRESAKTLGKALEGEFSENNLEEIEEDVVLDGLKVGLGAVKVFPQSGRIRYERVLPMDLIIDDAESKYRAPRCLYHRQLTDRYLAAALYGGDEDWLKGRSSARLSKILGAPPAESDDEHISHFNQIEVVEAWHLPSGPDADDGRWVLAIPGCTLVDTEWEHDRFPFAYFVPKRATTGLWGLSTMRNFAAAQREFEKIGLKLQRAHHRMGGAHILARKGACNPREITNDTGTIIEVDDINQVKDWTPAPANPQTYEYWRMLPEMALQFSGTSQFSAQSQVPSGLTNASGKALQTFQDTENRMRVGFHRARERLVVAVSELTIMWARKLVEENPKYSTRFSDGKRGFERVTWKKALIEPESYVLRIFPIGALSQSPSAKFAQLDTLLDRGAISIEQFKRLFDIPDLEAEAEVDSSDTDVIDRNLDWMVTRGKYLSPEPFDNKPLIVSRGRKFYNYCRRVEVPEPRLELIRRYIKAAQRMIDNEQAAKAPAPPPGGPGPMPMMPPSGAPQGALPGAPPASVDMTAPPPAAA